MPTYWFTVYASQPSNLKARSNVVTAKFRIKLDAEWYADKLREENPTWLVMVRP